jgi:hypothetical protein
MREGVTKKVTIKLTIEVDVDGDWFEEVEAAAPVSTERVKETVDREAETRRSPVGPRTMPWPPAPTVRCEVRRG